MNGAEAVAAILKPGGGVERVIGFPHSELIDTTAALGMAPAITRTERVAVNIADGFMRAGAEAAFGGVAQAFGDGTPLLFLPTGHLLGRSSIQQNFETLRNHAHVTGWSARAAADYAEDLIVCTASTPGKILTGPIDIGIDPQQLACSHPRTPWPRPGRPGDAAGAAAYLASDMASNVAGASLLADGGWMAR